MSRIHTYFPVRLLVALVLVFLNSATAFADNFCNETTSIDINSTVRSHGKGAVATECFETYLPSAGILMLEVGVPSDASAEPKLDFHGRLCDHSNALRKPFLYKDRAAASMLLAIRDAGTYSFCVAAQDPAQVLSEYKIVNGFVPFAFQKDNPDEDEPEPDPLTLDPSCPAGSSGEGPSVDELFADGFLKDNPDEDEPEPDPLVFDPCAGNELQHICRASNADDHGETLRCATPVRLGQEVAAEIHNGWGDDVDLFTFEVEELTSVRIETTGGSDTLGGLYDRHGYRLKVDDDGGRAGNFRIAKTLSPGRYFVRVEGSYGSEGAYRLLVESLSTNE